MTNKFLILITVLAFSALAMAVVVVGRISPPAPVAVAAPAPPAVPATTVIRGPQTITSSPAETVPEAQTPAFIQPLVNPVNTTDLSNLEHQVHLKKSDLASVSKSDWAKALPRAKQLLQGACDCEERNWLNHFIETGNDALAGATEYQDSAKLLLTLPKNDEEATKHVVSD